MQRLSRRFIGSLLAMAAAGIGCGAEDPEEWPDPLDNDPSSCAPFDTPQRTPTGIALDATHVYWANQGANPGEGAVLKANKSCGEATTIAADQRNPLALAVDDTSVYWLNDAALMKAPKEGGAPVLLADLGEEILDGDLALDEDRVYFTVYDEIRSVDKSGGSPELVAGSACVVNSVAIDDTSVYWADEGCDGTVVRMAKAGGERAVIATGQYSAGIAVDDTRVYWVGHGAVIAAPKAGGEGSILAGDARGGSRVVIDGTHLYYNGAFEELLGASKAGAAQETVGSGLPRRVAADASGVYWTTTDGRLRKAARPTGEGGLLTGTGSIGLSWEVNRGQNCAQGSVLSLIVRGPTGVTADVPCDAYGYVIDGLAAGTYSMTLELRGDQAIGFDLNAFEVGAGPLTFPEPFDMGECSLTDCGPKSVGCVDDGVCGSDDDCTCADCDTDSYCNPPPQNCPPDGVCRPYYEGCSCADCTMVPECVG